MTDSKTCLGCDGTSVSGFCSSCAGGLCTDCIGEYYLKTLAGKMPSCEACPNRCAVCSSAGCTHCKEHYELNAQQICDPKNSETIEIDDDHFDGDDRPDDEKIADVIAQLLELTGGSAHTLEWERRDGKYVVVISFESQAEKDAFENAVRSGDTEKLEFLHVVGLQVNGLSSSDERSLRASFHMGLALLVSGILRLLALLQ